MGRHSLPHSSSVRMTFQQMTPEGQELYRNQFLLQTRMDTMMADAAQVHANVQAYISAVKSKVDELHVDGGAAADLQAQLDEINDAVLSAHADLTGGDTGEVTDVPADQAPVEQPASDQSDAEAPADVPVAPEQDPSTAPVPSGMQQSQSPIDPTAPSVAPGFSV